MNNFYISFNIYNFKTDYGTIKTKIDYFIVPVKVIDGEKGTYQSTVGPSIYKDLKLKKIFGKTYYSKFKKSKDSVSFQIVIYTENNMETVEKEWMPKINKYLNKKMFFRKKFKKALSERIERILLTN